MRNILKKEIHHYGCDHVQASWLCKLSWKQQTVINQGLRAPDTHFCKGLKILCRWLRSIVLQNADKNHTFMCKKKDLPTLEDIENEINYCSVHFATHLVYALEIVAYTHPEEHIKKTAMNFYRGIVSELWHFNLESKHELNCRLSDVDRKPEPDPCPIDERKDRYLRGLD